MPGRFGLQQAQDQIRQNYDGNGQSQYNNNQNGQGQFNNFQGQGQYQAGPPQFDNNSGYNQPGNNYNRPPAGKFDGPGDRGPPPGARGAPSGGPPGRGPPPPAQSGPGGFAPGTGVDPARMSRRDEQPSRVITNTRMELPPEAYKLEGQNYGSALPDRPGFNTAGKQVTIKVNQYKVSRFPQTDVFQYDVQVGTGAEKMGKIFAVWNSKKVQEELQRVNNSHWLWDGNKIAWSGANIKEMRILVDLDAEKGRPPRPGREADTCYCIIKQTKQVRLAVIDAYLKKQISFDNSVLEAINFLDHVIRATPSKHYHAQKRSFFAKGDVRRVSLNLDDCVMAQKGVYSSIRLCSPTPSFGPGTGLGVNVDVANGTFWIVQDVHQAARNFCKQRNRNRDYGVMANLLRPVQSAAGVTMSEDFKELRKLCKLKFITKHRNTKHADSKKQYTIKRFVFNPKYGRDGGVPKVVTFPLRKPNSTDTEEISVYDFFKRQYNYTIQLPNLPLIETERDGMFPMEVCTLIPNQAYKFKLSPDQTAAMIKFAVTRPKQRLEAINHGVQMLKWHQDPILNHFGMKIESEMTISQARVLQNPEVCYAGGQKVNPGTSGRWDLRGKKFWVSNPVSLKSWGVIIVQGALDEPSVRNFLQTFISTYIGHGGRVENKNPPIWSQPNGMDLGESVAVGRQAIGNACRGMPEIILFVLPGRDSFMYERLKKGMECRFGMVSQMMNTAHVKKASPQYCSNVCMKLNAKLGGTTCKVFTGVGPKVAPMFPRPTMIIGADVSHASPGSQQASMAALTMSFDKDACRYAAGVQTNGHRVEMITEANIEGFFGFLLPEWVKQVGGGNLPMHIYYFRDGVSEGQYSHVLDQEVADMKKMIEKLYPGKGKNIKWTITVCSKRHHIRFFPKPGDPSAGDKNENSLPGTLVERDVTHPFEYDFYLSSHSAIQGTARPTHYHVLEDEARVPPNDFQAMIYKHCYQYMRSTTPVSLFPAVYYAHLASNRARAHESKAASEGPRGGQKFEERQQDDAQRRAAGKPQSSFGGSSRSGDNTSEARPLLPIGELDSADRDRVIKIRTGMWYI